MQRFFLDLMGKDRTHVADSACLYFLCIGVHHFFFPDKIYYLRGKKMEEEESVCLLGNVKALKLSPFFHLANIENLLFTHY
jgi:hypothetical protein